LEEEEFSYSLLLSALFNVSGTITAAVFSGTVALGGLFLAIYRLRKRRMSPNANEENGER